MFNPFLIAFLFLSPILFLSPSVLSIAALQWYQFGYFSSSINLFQVQFFMYGIFFLSIISLFDNPKRLYQDEYIKWFLLLAFINVYSHPKTINSFLIVFLGFLLFYLVSVCFDQKSVKKVFIAIAIVASLNTGFAVLQAMNIHLIYHPSPTHEVIGLMGYKTHLGIYQALAMPICYALNPWLMVVPMIGLLLSKSGTAIIPAIIGMAYFFRNKIFSNSILICVAAACFLVLIKNFHKFILRFDVWGESLKTISQHWVTGYGFNVFKYIGHDLEKKIYTDSYSIYFDVTHWLGVGGLIVIFLFLKDNFFKVKMDDNFGKALFSSCLILAIVGVGYSFMDYPRLAGTAIILFGLLGIYNKEKESLFL